MKDNKLMPDRVNKILNHDLFAENLMKNKMAEEGRIFCKHNMEHFLDVARLAMILNLTEGFGVDKELIYAAALLHDIGRFRQYEEGIPHDKESARIAPKILKECGFNDKETNVIVLAILSHRDAQVREERNLSGLLYRADKMSRNCFACKVEGQCDWKADKKNLTLQY